MADAGTRVRDARRARRPRSSARSSPIAAGDRRPQGAQVADRAHRVDPVTGQDRDPGAVIAAVFELLKSPQQQGTYVSGADVADDAAHLPTLLDRDELRARWPTGLPRRPIGRRARILTAPAARSRNDACAEITRDGRRAQSGGLRRASRRPVCPIRYLWWWATNALDRDRCRHSKQGRHDRHGRPNRPTPQYFAHRRLLPQTAVLGPVALAATSILIRGRQIVLKPARGGRRSEVAVRRCWRRI